MTAARSLTSRLAGHRAAVIGDVMLDHFLIGRVDRISPEAPVPVVKYARDDYRLGGAANVAVNIAALGGQASLVGVVGKDEAADKVRSAMTSVPLATDGLMVDPSRPTTRKLRVVTSRNQQVARIDYEQDGEVSGSSLEALCRHVRTAAANARAIVLSDYRKGTIVPAVIAAAADAARAAKTPLLVDPKVPQAERYRGATLITPNHHEAELMTQQSVRSTDDARRAARALHEKSGASVLITWGEHGMWVLDMSSGSPVEAHLPAAAREVADVTGAGDTVIAVLALGLAAGATLVDAARLANLAAGLVVARFGPASVLPAELAAAEAGGAG